MALVRWTFTDPVAVESYTFAVNPSEGGTPGYQKQLQYQATAAPNGKTLVFEGRDQPQKIEFSGTILEQAHFNAFVTWWNKRNQIKITDDLGREYWVVIDSFQPTRQRALQYPWKHSYKISATVVSYP